MGQRHGRTSARGIQGRQARREGVTLGIVVQRLPGANHQARRRQTDLGAGRAARAPPPGLRAPGWAGRPARIAACVEVRAQARVHATSGLGGGHAVSSLQITPRNPARRAGCPRSTSASTGQGPHPPQDRRRAPSSPHRLQHRWHRQTAADRTRRSDSGRGSLATSVRVLGHAAVSGKVLQAVAAMPARCMPPVGQTSSDTTAGSACKARSPMARLPRRRSSTGAKLRSMSSAHLAGHDPGVLLGEATSRVAVVYLAQPGQAGSAVNLGGSAAPDHPPGPHRPGERNGPARADVASMRGLRLLARGDIARKEDHAAGMRASMHAPRRPARCRRCR